MHCSKFILVIILILLKIVVPVTSQAQVLSHGERCHIIEGNGVRIDECDGSKLLHCKDGRCQCADPANQIYTYRVESTESRRRRDAFKTLTKTVKKTVGGGKKHKKKRTKKVYSCYSRAGAPCNLNYNNWKDTTETTPPPTPAPAAPTEATGGSTTSAESTTPTVITTTTKRIDVASLPRCVQNAVCRSKTANTADDTGAASEHVEHTDSDPRIGICDCELGYLRNSKDLCKEIPQDDQNGQMK